MAALYQVTFRWIKTEADPAKIEKVFDSLGDWARLNAYSWFVWSDLTPTQIYNALRAHFDTEDSIAVFGVNSDHRAGWAPGWFWDWVKNKGRGKPTS